MSRQMVMDLEAILECRDIGEDVGVSKEVMFGSFVIAMRDIAQIKNVFVRYRRFKTVVRLMYEYINSSSWDSDTVRAFNADTQRLLLAMHGLDRFYRFIVRASEPDWDVLAAYNAAGIERMIDAIE
jgi:hypothetical protein